VAGFYPRDVSIDKIDILLYFGVPGIDTEDKVLDIRRNSSAFALIIKPLIL